MHFIASFTLSCLIALAYSLCGSQFVIQRALYPRMWDDVRHFTAGSRRSWNRWPRVWSGFSARLLGFFRRSIRTVLSDASSHIFRGLVASLIIFGWAGYQLATRVAPSLTEIVIALTECEKLKTRELLRSPPAWRKSARLYLPDQRRTASRCIDRLAGRRTVRPARSVA